MQLSPELYRPTVRPARLPRRLDLSGGCVEDRLRLVRRNALDSARTALVVASICRLYGDRSAAAANLEIAAGWRLTAATAN